MNELNPENQGDDEGALDNVYGTHPSIIIPDVSYLEDNASSTVTQNVTTLLTAKAIAPVPPEFQGTKAKQHTPPIPPIEAAYNLNRANIPEIMEHQSLLSLAQSVYLKNIERKLQIHAERFSDLDYHPRAAMLILSDWRQAQEFSSCCANRSGFKRCNRYSFCPYCCYLKRQRALRTYLRSFSKTTWSFLTLSFTDGVNFESAAWSCIDRWDACAKAMKSLVSSGFVQGAYWIEETAVLGFLPITVNPHIHAIIDGTVSASALEQLKETIGKSRVRNGEPLAATPSIKVRPIPTQSGLLKTIKYMFKPIDMVKAYKLAWLRAEKNNRALAMKLNSELREFVTGHSTIIFERDKIHAEGTLSAKRSGIFIGVPKAEREDQTELIQTIEQETDDFYPGSSS